MPMFTLKSRPQVEMRQFDGTMKTAIELMHWTGFKFGPAHGDRMGSEKTIAPPCAIGNGRIAQIGDWVVRDFGGDYFLLHDEQKDRLFEPAV